MTSTLPATRRRLVVVYRGRTVRLQFRPADITLASMDDAMTDPDGTAARFVAGCVAGWSLRTPEGRPYPTTLAAVENLPAGLVRELASAIALEAARALTARKP